MTKNEIKNIIELFISWNGEDSSIDIANLDSAIEYINECINPSTSVNLDEAAIEYAHKYTKDENGNGGDDWEDDIRITFKAGAEWMKEQMMRKAVEGYVNYYEDSGGILMAKAQVGYPYHNGDKVRIIIVKED